MLYFCSGWLLCWVLVVTPPREILCFQEFQQRYIGNHKLPPFHNIDGDQFNAVLSEILLRRHDWKTDFEQTKWLPKWKKEDNPNWETQHQQQPWLSYYNSVFPLSQEEEATHDDLFWKKIVSNQNYTFANANIGLGHRLAQLSYSYLCQVVPYRQQQLIHWVTGGLDDNRGWHHLFQDSPILAGVPLHWKKGKPSLEAMEIHRNETSSSVSGCGDYSTYFPLNDCDMCRGFKHPRDLWFLRFAKEPSIQEFYRLLRAQVQPRIKQRVADFMKELFPNDKLVIGVHLRAGNGKDDGLGHFDLVKRGDWLNTDLPKAIQMVRQHARLVAHSILDRYNMGMGYDIDDMYRKFLATDTEQVLAEFRKQDPSVLSLDQERPNDGVAIFQSADCAKDSDPVECALVTQENMLMDALLLLSVDVLLAEIFSNFLYTLPASLALADGKIFCEAGRAALGGRYITQDDRQASLMGDPQWWANPPPNVMPVRCQTSAWAARDRSNLFNFPDVMATASAKG